MTGKLSHLAVPLLAVLGLADSAYLATLHFRGELPQCGDYSGCADVNSSPYSEMFGIPVAALGAGLYLMLLGIGLWRTRASGKAFLWATLALYGLLVSGAVFMVYLTAVELFVLHAVCYWCVGLATITVILLGIVGREVWRAQAPGAPQSG